MEKLSTTSNTSSDVEINFDGKKDKNVLDCDLKRIKLTPSEELHNIAAFDTTVEIVGYVDVIEASRLVGEKKLKLFKFFLNNAAGDRVQVVAWRDEVDRCEAIIKPNLILHIDGAYAKPSAVGNFNKGTINFEIIIQSTTVLNIFGWHSIEETKLTSKLINLKDIGKTATNNYIRVQAFVKTNFGVIVKANGGNDFGCGSITDGHFKIEVRIPKMKNIDHELTKGDHVEVEGEIQMNANPIYIQCKSIDDVKKIDDTKLTLEELLRGYRVIRKEVENDGTPAKKNKRD